MHYRSITLIGDSYGSEVGRSGHRTDSRVWEKIQTKLKAAIVDLRNASNPTATAEAQAKVDHCRTWLAREGANADADGNVAMAPMANLTVYYDVDAMRQHLTRIYFQGGRLYTDLGCTRPLNTAGMVTHFSGPGKAIYVMTANGNLHIASHVVGNYHHSSLLAGAPVACAGEIEVNDGYIDWLSNKSGHYAPNPDHMMQILHQLMKKNVPMDFPVTLAFPPPAAAKNFTSVAALEGWLRGEGYDDYEVTKLLAYSAHLTDSVLGANNWRWRDPTSEEIGVYNKTTNARVDHKAVRQWLKAHGHHANDVIQTGHNR